MNIPKDLKERNIWFEGLSKTEKAVVVAQDVIAQVNANKFVPRHNKYFIVPTLLKAEDNLQEVIESVESCQVCAIGAVFASKVRLGNNVMGNDLRDISKFEGLSGNESNCYGIENHIQDIFEEENYRLMEVAFEASDAVSYFGEKYGYEEIWDEDEGYYYDDETPDSSDYRLAISFNESYDDSTELLIAIMQNVIDNNGIFIP